MASYWFLEALKIRPTEMNIATNDFADENFIARGSYATVYKGKYPELGDMVNIVVRRFPQPNTSFVDNELMMYENLKHENIISLFKLVDFDGTIAFINKYEENGSLDNHLKGSTLIWMQRLRICVGVARALRYLHFGLEDDYIVIHGNIKSSKILLDHNWEPKLHDFRCAVKVKRHHLYLTTKYYGTLEYMDPAFERTGGLTHKSDVFSFGIVLFEVLFGMKASSQEADNQHFAKLARLCYEENCLDDMIDCNLRKQMDTKSLKIFSETAYFCLKEKREDRPDMEQIVIRLEKALENHQSFVHPPAAVESPLSRLKGEDMDRLRFPLSKIQYATEKFSDTYLIGSGAYGNVYKAELQCFDGVTRTTAVKRMTNKEDTKVFVAEIELLTKCKHENIISLHGFCDKDGEMILVYQWASNGSLDGYLKKVDKMTHLNWDQRLEICLQIARGLQYLNNGIDKDNMIIHRDIKSENILLNDEFVAKIADFGLSTLRERNQNTVVASVIAGTPNYIDPVYERELKLKGNSDIYSFGVVLFEILSGKLAYDPTFKEGGLAAEARQCYKDGTINKLVDPKIKEADEDIFILNGAVNQVSLDKFSDIAYKCVVETQNDRPTIEEIIKELREALNHQISNKDNLHISLQVIKSGTENFNDCKCIGEGRYWKQYAGEIVHANKLVPIIAKRWDNNFAQSRHLFLTELQFLNAHRHENIVSLVGYCNEMGEKITVYESASNGSLDKHLGDANLHWKKRLEIGIDVAKGLEFLHTEVSMIHRDIKTASILLDGDWKAKISNLEQSSKMSEIKSIDHITKDSAYVYERHMKNGYLSHSSDAYALGVVLKEMLSGRLLKPEEIYGNFTFEGMKEQIDDFSLSTFGDIVHKCFVYQDSERAKARNVIEELETALALQEDAEEWNSRLPKAWNDLIKRSDIPHIFDSIILSKERYHIFLKGILLDDGNLWFSLGSNDERNEMISARNFSYRNRRSHRWRSIQGSRFPKVAEITDISNLKIQIKLKKQLISPSANHRVHLIFRFRGPRKSQAKRMYVNLKYKTGNETLHAYFATWREDGWMMIQLFQVLNQKEDTDFEVLLDSFSRCYRGSNSIYIEGIEFQSIDNMNYEETERFKEVQKVDLNTDQGKEGHHLQEEKQETMLSAKKIVYASSKFTKQERYKEIYHDSNEFYGAIDCLQFPVLRLRCKIQRQILTANTNNMCYLVFQLSEKCGGLHGPVIVRDILQRKETRILYFRSPNPCNILEGDSIPKKREDGWMEVILWIFDPDHKLKDEYFYFNLVTYEGTMSGLILRGIEFRAI